MTVRPAPDRPRIEVGTLLEDAPRRPHHWRWWAAAVLTLVVAAHLAGGWYLSGRIGAEVLAVTPGTTTPAFDDARVVSLEGDLITLRRGTDAGGNFEAPASYGLAWAGGTGHVGPASVNPDGTVTRPLDLVKGAPPKAGQGVAMERAYYLGDPASTLGLRSRTVTIAGAPAWFVPAKASVAAVAIFVHGQNGTRADGLRFVAAAHRAGLAALVISYRNDAGAPADPSGRLQYGATEWRDLDAAVAWAQAHGLRRVALAGQSMGGAIVASFLEHSSRRGAVSRVFLDAPMLSLSQVVSNGAGSALPGGLSLPGSIVWTGEQLAGLRYGVDWAAVDYLDDTSWLRVPTLVTHGTADPVVPVSGSEQLRDAAPKLVTLKEFPRALHAESWNFDMFRWDDAVVAFLRPVAR
ncbi:alpha/beta fold hydrolase [Terrabacter aerolatus]|uniref:Alpha/beta hydrolase n=1 Tax=Terrabacter aerolatus TaxID=422442 RepID=A0A512D3L1_9MICO|nr:lysophospholipase [Terrabacter aerolatus]GEO31047.1 alpha/beta hydrolase [Terrabacter aerolatus]